MTDVSKESLDMMDKAYERADKVECEFVSGESIQAFGAEVFQDWPEMSAEIRRNRLEIVRLNKALDKIVAVAEETE